ncbi:MAG: selenocysteine-specific translation elongation factor [Clostridia bacterium]|nr:selenocysteine-specific translation elongation factor [Clostridia bacterium]
MKNIIVGTSGHVDHGKTCLIKAVTGMDTDRLKEEKKRGITIENGFADFTYGDYNISIIDVPGHEKFVRNMLMGIGGIDLVLLVVGLDEGVMPQTVEHFRILSMLDIKKGIIVYTKRDLIDDDMWVEMVKEDARDLVKGTFMEGAPEIEVSSYTGLNIDRLKEMIVENIDDSLLKNDSDDLFRLPIDRVFTIDGFGTVITGTLTEGRVNVQDEIMLYPKMIPTKVRNIEVHNENVKTAFAGQRTALNLLNLKKEEIERGSVLATVGGLNPSMMLDVKLEVFRDSERSIINDSRVHFYSGASEAVARVVLLDRDTVGPGESCYAQLRLEEEIVTRRNDRFIVRFLSPLITIGGGVILEETPRKHKRNDERALDALKVKDSGNDKDILEVLIKENILDVSSLSRKMRLPKERTESLINELQNDSKIVVLKNRTAVHNEYIDIIGRIAKGILEEYHRENAMSFGLQKEDFKSRVLVKSGIKDKKLLDEIVSILEERKVIKIEENTVSLFGFKVNISKDLTDRILKKYQQAKFEMPTVDDIVNAEKDKKNARHAIDLLEREGKLVRLNYMYYIAKEFYDTAFEAVRDITEKNGSMALAEFRDRIGTSRKYAIPILEYMDEKKITKMNGEVRVWNLNS